MKKLNLIFFGTSSFAVECLMTLKEEGCVPSVIVTNPDRPQGRGLELAPPPVKIWAEKEGIETWQPEKLDAAFVEQSKTRNFDIGLVASYGLIIPSNVFSLPRYKTLNIHPSLLPKYRGATPLEAQILTDEKKIGVSLMVIDAKMDHGPIVASELYTPERFPIDRGTLEKKLAALGSKLFLKCLDDYTTGAIKVIPQDDAAATFTKKILKKDTEINLAGDPYKNYLTYLAYSPTPRTYFLFTHKGQEKRAIITEATFANNSFTIMKVIPEGKKEMAWSEFAKIYLS